MVQRPVEWVPTPPGDREVLESPWGTHRLMALVELERDPFFQDLKRLGDRYNFEYQHSAQVCRLSLALFDDLQEYHHLDERDRALLMAGSFLHDIGAFGQSSASAEARAGVHGVHDYKHHHKRSQKILLKEGVPDLASEEVRLVSCVARYHTKGLPEDTDEVYKDLSKAQRKKVRILAGILRVADSLDRRHASMAKDLRCHLSRDRKTLTIWLYCKEHGFDWRPKHRTDLLEEVFVVQVKIPILFGVRVG
jgi:exopolyphosphatase/guanosine-5'-triphosphate,3'-diphosphate pyrophosphatase